MTRGISWIFDMERFDKYWIGIVIGLLLPAIFGLIYIDRMNLWQALSMMSFASGSILNKLLLAVIFPDLALLFVFYQLEAWRLAKGLLTGAIPYMLASLFVSL